MLARSKPHAEHPPSRPAPSAAPMVPASNPEPKAASREPESTGPDTLSGALVHFGLTAHEAKMYETLLQNGPSTARHAIVHSGLDRATGYRILARLRARGLATATGHRPKTFVALDSGRFLERVSAVLKDELEIHRILRDAYAAELSPARHAPTPIPRPPNFGTAPALAAPAARPAGGRFRLLPTPAEQERYLSQMIRSAAREMDGLIRPMAMPLAHRLEVAREIGRAVNRRVKVRLVLDYQASELDYLAAILREAPVGAPSLEVRFHGPQLSALYLFDQHQATRLVRSPAMGAPGAHFGISSAEPEFVRLQVARFQSVWRDAVPVAHALRSSEGSVAIPGASFKELRRWVDDVTASEVR